MFNLVDMINLQMRKNNISSYSQLLDKMNALNEKQKFYKQHLSDVVLGKQVQIEYLYAMEKVFNLPENTLVEMADLSKTKSGRIRGDGKRRR